VTDPHSPGKYRVNGLVVNMPEFRQAFGCSAGKPLYLYKEESGKRSFQLPASSFQLPASSFQLPALPALSFRLARIPLKFSRLRTEPGTP
jgi:hypothetical protein